VAERAAEAARPAEEQRSPQRHRLDVFALTVGLLCLAVSGLALAARADLADVDVVVVLAAFWLVLGVVGLTRSLSAIFVRSGSRDA